MIDCNGLRLLKTVLLVYFLSANKSDGQIIGNFFRDPINSFIKVFDGSYLRPTNDQVRNDNLYTIQSYQQRPVDASLNFNVQRPRASSNQLSVGFCSGVWSYGTDHEGNTIGLLRVYNPSRIKNVLKLNLSLAATLPSNYAGAIDLAKDKDSSAQDAINGRPLLYRVEFPVQNPIPKLLSATHNDQLLCSEPLENKPYTALSLVHTYYTGLPANIEQIMPRTNVMTVEYTTQRFRQMVTPRERIQTPPPTVLMPEPRNPQPQILSRFGSNQCGVPDYKQQSFTSLIVRGRFAERGQFPWLAAFYYNGRSESGFICGGSLVSPKIIITAAHCVISKNPDNVARNPDEALFYLGKYNLENLAGDHYFTVSGVDRFDVHPDWNIQDDRYDADIAVALLIRTITFTKFVKPICLWAGSSSYEDLVGLRGTIAGWGKTEYTALATDRPKWTNLVIVDTVTCLRSNSAFSALTSDRTFCAGDRDGSSGPCNGDSGGGLAIEVEGIWYLRGIVSSSLLADGVCDTKNYAVFTDIQKFSPWLQSYVQS